MSLEMKCDVLQKIVCLVYYVCHLTCWSRWIYFVFLSPFVAAAAANAVAVVVVQQSSTWKRWHRRRKHSTDSLAQNGSCIMVILIRLVCVYFNKMHFIFQENWWQHFTFCHIAIFIFNVCHTNCIVNYHNVLVFEAFPSTHVMWTVEMTT